MVSPQRTASPTLLSFQGWPTNDCVMGDYEGLFLSAQLRTSLQGLSSKELPKGSAEAVAGSAFRSHFCACPPLPSCLSFCGGRPPRARLSKHPTGYTASQSASWECRPMTTLTAALRGRHHCRSFLQRTLLRLRKVRCGGGGGVPRQAADQHGDVGWEAIKFCD